MDVALGRGGVEVELPDLPEEEGGMEWWSVGVLGGRVVRPSLQHSQYSITPFRTVSNAYTTPLPPAKKIRGRPFTVAMEGADQVLWKMFGAMCSLSRAT